MNPGDYVYVGPKTIFNITDPSVSTNLTVLTAYLEQHWNFSGVLEEIQSPSCKEIMRKALCTYYYPVCRNASGNATVPHVICPDNCNYTSRSVCPTAWERFYHLSLTAPAGFNLRLSCQVQSSVRVPPSTYCCINIASGKSVSLRNIMNKFTEYVLSKRTQGHLLTKFDPPPPSS